MKTRSEEIEELLMENSEQLKLNYKIETEPLLEHLIDTRIALEIEKHYLERKYRHGQY